MTGDGKTFVHAGGTVVKKTLKGETLRVDTGCLVAFTKGIDYNIERAGNLKSMVLGGEGLFLATLSGHGTVLLQSLPFSRLADRVFNMLQAWAGARPARDRSWGDLGTCLVTDVVYGGIPQNFTLANVPASEWKQGLSGRVASGQPCFCFARIFKS